MEEEVCEKSPLLVCLLSFFLFLCHINSAAGYSFIRSLKTLICSVHQLLTADEHYCNYFFFPGNLLLFPPHCFRAEQKRSIMLRHALYSSIWSYRRSPCVYVIQGYGEGRQPPFTRCCQGEIKFIMSPVRSFDKCCLCDMFLKVTFNLLR